MKSLCISAIASNQGKTILTMALLYHFRESVRPFKIGPDYIDPQFHTLICKTPSLNLDNFMMNEKQVKWIYQHYSDKNISICEGVMGFYDGMDKGSSAYDLTKLLQIPTVLLLDGSGSYITISAVLKGLVTYKNDNTIKAIVLNKLSSPGHYELIKNQIEKDFGDAIVVLGWIQKDLESLSETHLGLDLQDTSKIESISKDVLKNIDIELLTKVASNSKKETIQEYPFEKIEPINKKIAIVNDKNFSFLYHDNSEFLQEIFQKVVFVDSTKDERIPSDCDVVYIVGGYVESDSNYANIKDSTQFRESLINHAKTKQIYAECAGLLYLGKSVDDKKMSGILDLNFTLHKRFQRMGYYYTSEGIKGHSFHYTNIINPPLGVDILSKKENGDGQVGSWEKDKVFGTYLHTMLRSNVGLIRKRFI